MTCWLQHCPPGGEPKARDPSPHPPRGVPSWAQAPCGETKGAEIFHLVDEEHVTCWLHHCHTRGGPIDLDPSQHPPRGCHLGPMPQLGKPRAQKFSTRWMRHICWLYHSPPGGRPITRDSFRHPPRMVAILGSGHRFGNHGRRNLPLGG